MARNVKSKARINGPVQVLAEYLHDAALLSV